MNLYIKIQLTLVLLLFGIFIQSCETVKPYQKMYISDQDMLLSPCKLEGAEISFQTYREGASGANGGKVGGGCGCN